LQLALVNYKGVDYTMDDGSADSLPHDFMGVRVTFYFFLYLVLLPFEKPIQFGFSPF
jgi:hypothetical protein